MPTDAELPAFPGTLTWRRHRQIGDRARLANPSDWYFSPVLGADTAEELVEACLRAARIFTIQTDVESAAA